MHFVGRHLDDGPTLLLLLALPRHSSDTVAYPWQGARLHRSRCWHSPPWRWPFSSAPIQTPLACPTPRRSRWGGEDVDNPVRKRTPHRGRSRGGTAAGWARAWSTLYRALLRALQAHEPCVLLGGGSSTVVLGPPSKWVTPPREGAGWLTVSPWLVGPIKQTHRLILSSWKLEQANQVDLVFQHWGRVLTKESKIEYVLHCHLTYLYMLVLVWLYYWPIV
jgi:hypothetical protein